MNSVQLKAKLKNISQKKHVDFNTLLRLYMYDRFIERLAVSRYKDNFILKGGFYLGALFGVENRTIMDIDTAFKNDLFNEETISKMIDEIISIELGDNTKLYNLGISSIRNDDEYGGFRVVIEVKLENIREIFHIDIATGDPITPREIRYKYKPVLSENCIDLWAYNIETIMAEKLETISSRAELNGRMRDFYDVYLIYTKDFNNINIDTLKTAIEKTFSNRGYTANPQKTLDLLMNSKLLAARWEIYIRKHEYAQNIDFKEILNCIQEIIKVIDI